MVSFYPNVSHLNLTKIEVEPEVLHVELEESLSIHFKLHTDLVQLSLVRAQDFGLDDVGRAIPK